MYKFNDWQDLSIKKDVEKILKHQAKVDGVGLALTFDAALAILLICGERILDWDLEQKSILVFWIFVILGFLPFLITAIISIIKSVARKTSSVRMLSPSAQVDTFDNDLCVYVMMAQSYLHMTHGKFERANTSDPPDVATDQHAPNSTDDELRTLSANEMTFFYIETCFYINKVISGLVRMSYHAEKVFSVNYDDLCVNKLVSIERLENMLLLLNELISAVSHIQIENLDEVNLTRNINNKHRESLITFCCMINEKFNRKIAMNFPEY